MRYALAMIKSFADKRTAAIFVGLCPKGTPPDVANVARRKLAMVDKAVDLNDLRSPPGNRLEALERDRKGPTQHPRERPVARVLPLDGGWCRRRRVL